MVGTHWLWVTRSRSISARASAGSKRSMTTTVPPHTLDRHGDPQGRGVVERGRAQEDHVLAEAVAGPAVLGDLPLPSGESARGGGT